MVLIVELRPHRGNGVLVSLLSNLAECLQRGQTEPWIARGLELVGQRAGEAGRSVTPSFQCCEVVLVEQASRSPCLYRQWFRNSVVELLVIVEETWITVAGLL